MSWVWLVIAGLLEVVWALGLKHTHGFTRLVPSIGTIAAIVVSLFLLAHATKSIPIGTAYAVWVGIGAVGAALGGIWLHGEPLTAWRVVFLASLVGSIVGLKVTST